MVGIESAMFFETARDNTSLLQRNKEREYRKEHQLILKRCNQIGFQYIINRPPPALTGICFGSRIKRDVLPMCGPSISPFMGRFTLEAFKYPARFHTSPKKQVFASGVGLLASKTARFSRPNSSAPGATYILPPQVQTKSQNLAAFGSSTQTRQPHRRLNTSPGVGTYNISTKRKQMVIASFGGKIRHKPATVTLCAPEQRDRCQKCNEIPEIDYWKHFRLDNCYCRACMQTEVLDCNANVKIKFIKFKRLKLLREYERVRYCGYMHKHDKTRACLQILPQLELTRKIRRENYLSMFYM